MERVATYSHQNTLVQYMLKSEAKVATAQIQSSSGLKSTDYRGIADDSARVVNLESHYKRLERYIDEGEVVTGRIQTMYDSVGGMVDLTNRLRSLVTELQGAAASNAAGVQTEINGLMKEFTGLLNTQQEGRYLFAGSRTGTAPVSMDPADYPPQTSPSTPSTSYYKGDGIEARFRASDDLVLDYGVTADNPAFEKALRAFSLLGTMSVDPIDTAAVNEASALAAQAADGMAVVQSKLGVSASALDRTINQHLDTQLVLQTQVDDLKNIDVGEAVTRLSQMQASLEMTMKILSMVSQNDLSKYL
jgi:Flagellin and related hook-associated proteins